MKTLALSAVLVLSSVITIPLAWAADNDAGSAPPVAVAPPTQAPAETPLAPPEQPPAPPVQQQVSSQSSQTGQWVYTQQYGWVWMPYGDTYSYVPPSGEGEPYEYVYYPDYGWTWIGAPWVWGLGPWPYFGLWGPGRFGWYTHGWWRTPALWHYRLGFHGGFTGRWYGAGFRGGFRSPAGHGVTGAHSSGHGGGHSGGHR